MTRDANHASLPVLRGGLRAPAQTLLEAVLREAERRGLALYLVGGAVREMLRGRAGGAGGVGGADLDLVVEGPIRALAATAAAGLGAKVVAHDVFGTARLRLDGAALDLARARVERYARPGALPEVRPASIEADLGRRDFSVNAMALGLSGPRAGVLLDPLGGRADLERGLVRVLHDRSFRDDPTRLIRACRYAARIEGRLARGTGVAARRDGRYLSRLTPERFAEAWRRLLLEPAAPGALERAAALRLPAARVEGWEIAPRLRRAFEALREDQARETFWALAGLSVEEGVARRLSGRCAMQREERSAFQDGRALRRLRPFLGRAGLADSAAAAQLRPRGAPALRAAAQLWRGRAGARAGAQQERWGAIVSPLNGDELARLGVPPGPGMGRWLERLRDAAIDGEIPRGWRGASAARRLVRAGRLESGDKGRSARS